MRKQTDAPSLALHRETLHGLQPPRGGAVIEGDRCHDFRVTWAVSGRCGPTVPDDESRHGVCLTTH